MTELVKIDNNVSPLMPTVLVGTSTAGKVNFMTAAWCTRVNSKPPLIAVAIGKGKTTTQAIQANREFSICIPKASDMVKTDYCGMNAGAKTDKSSVFDTVNRGSTNMPLIPECSLNLECSLRNEVDLPDSIIFIGEITAAYAGEAYVADGEFRLDRSSPFLYGMDNSYYDLGNKIGTAWAEGPKYSK